MTLLTFRLSVFTGTIASLWLMEYRPIPSFRRICAACILFPFGDRGFHTSVTGYSLVDNAHLCCNSLPTETERFTSGCRSARRCYLWILANLTNQFDDFEHLIIFEQPATGVVHIIRDAADHGGDDGSSTSQSFQYGIICCRVLHR